MTAPVLLRAHIAEDHLRSFLPPPALEVLKQLTLQDSLAGFGEAARDGIWLGPAGEVEQRAVVFGWFSFLGRTSGRRRAPPGSLLADTWLKAAQFCNTSMAIGCSTLLRGPPGLSCSLRASEIDG